MDVVKMEVPANHSVTLACRSDAPLSALQLRS